METQKECPERSNDKSLGQPLGRSPRLWAMVILVLGALFILLTLISYDPKDGEYSYPGNTHVHNYGGRIGSILAERLYKWLGVVSFLVPLLLVGIAFLTLRRTYLLWLWGAWVLWGMVLLLWGCTVASLGDAGPLLSDRMHSYGGITGLFLFTSLHFHLGSPGIAAILIVTGVALTFNAFTLWVEQHFLSAIAGGQKGNQKTHLRTKL